MGGDKACRNLMCFQEDFDKMDIFDKEMPGEGKPLQGENRRYFQIAGITVCVESSLDFNRIKFKEKFNSFAVDGPGSDNAVLSHYFSLPDMESKDLGDKVYHKIPWRIYRKNGLWIYLGILKEPNNERIYSAAVFKDDYSRAKIYHRPAERERRYQDGWPSLSLFPTDQIWLAPLLADRRAFFLHSSAAILNGQGLIFVGHSDAGKSTTLKMLEGNAEILCDDRNIVRRWDGGWRLHGTWSHGELPYVSSSSAPLRAVLFLKQDGFNKIVPVSGRREIWTKLLVTIIKPMVTAEWWHKEIDAMGMLVNEVPFYTMHFDKSGKIVQELKNLTKK